MTDLFNEQMTFEEAQLAFFKAIDGKTKEEAEEIRKQFFAAIPKITKREITMAEKGWIQEGNGYLACSY